MECNREIITHGYSSSSYIILGGSQVCFQVRSKARAAVLCIFKKIYKIFISFSFSSGFLQPVFRR